MGPRALWKRAFVDPGLIQDVTIMFLSGGRQSYPFQTESRNSTIIPEFVGLRFEVYNGRDYTVVDVKEEHVGYKVSCGIR